MNIILQNLKLSILNLGFKRFKKCLPPCYVHLPKSMLYDENCERKPPIHPETPRFLDEYGSNSKVKGKVYDKKPFRMICKPNVTYWWCSCGHSKTQPFCDGHHKIILGPTGSYFIKKFKFRPIKTVFDKVTEVWWCNCKQTNKAPFCDGSHLANEIQEKKIV